MRLNEQKRERESRVAWFCNLQTYWYFHLLPCVMERWVAFGVSLTFGMSCAALLAER